MSYCCSCSNAQWRKHNFFYEGVRRRGLAKKTKSVNDINTSGRFEIFTTPESCTHPTPTTGKNLYIICYVKKTILSDTLVPRIQKPSDASMLIIRSFIF